MLKEIKKILSDFPLFLNKKEVMLLQVQVQLLAWLRSEFF